MHWSIRRPWILGRGDLRIPAQSQSAPSAQSLAGLRIAIVSRAHSPSIMVPWQGSVQHLRQDGDRRTA